MCFAFSSSSRTFTEDSLNIALYSATQRLFATDLVVLSHGHVMKTTPQQAHLYFHTPPTGGRLSLNIYNMHQPLLHGTSSVLLGSNSSYCIAMHPLS
ncbi:hypothetical protein TNCV_2708781 [Trichonephila clavipes]|nr:hypothetical protein TNCV_2708781 [Trichonephila clavipes]